ncbi:MAG: zinc-binding dehydrogenase [Miltoncostaeaceae bacterium]
MISARAIAIDADDPLSGLSVQETPDPDPPADWTVVDVRAAAVNHHDLWSLRGLGMKEEWLPVTLGTDAAGVTEDGEEVIVHAVLSDPADGAGDETLSPDLHLLSERGINGTLAQKVAVPRRNLVAKPPELSFEQAACLPTAYLTAYVMLFRRGGLQPGQSVLVQGAGGGVASAAILLATAAGARVYATSRSPEKLAWAEEQGAVGVEHGARLPERVHVVVETVGAATWKHSLLSLRTGGTLTVSGRTSGDPPADLALVFWRGLTVAGSTMGRRSELEDVASFVATSGIRPAIDSVHDLADAATAFGRMEAGETTGKVVLAP